MKSITEHFAADHDRLDALFTKFQSLKRKDPAAAKENFRGFLKGLTRHIGWEEDILFPIFEEKGGMGDCGPTAVMRMEHIEIKRHLDAIHDKVREGDPESDASEKALLAVLQDHNMKEEQILYPAIDQGLDQAGLALVQKAIEAGPEEHACGCSGHH